MWLHSRQIRIDRKAAFLRQIRAKAIGAWTLSDTKICAIQIYIHIYKYIYKYV